MNCFVLTRSAISKTPRKSNGGFTGLFKMRTIAPHAPHHDRPGSGRRTLSGLLKRLVVLPILIGATICNTLAPGPAAAAPSNSKANSAAVLPAVSGEQLVSIDFNDVDIVVFIKFISDLTKKNFIIDDKVRGKVTIISPGKITVAEAYQVFLSVLEVYGYTIVPSGRITKIVPSAEARSKSIKTQLEQESGNSTDNVVTQIIPLHYADPDEIKQLFTPLVSRSSVILAYTPTNTLIITDVQSNIKRLLHILKAIDITGVGQQIAIIPVEYADATKLVNLLTSIFPKGPRRKGAAEKDITFVADERTNSIVLLASEGDTDNIRKLIKNLDKETPKGQANIHVYYLENASAEDVAKVLQDIPQKNTANDKTPGKKSAPVISEKVRIAADKATNSLIITADPEDYVVLENIIKKIDIPRAMVYIEALIMEVNVDKDFRLGTEWLAGGEATYNNRNGIYTGGFSAGGFGGDPGTLGTAVGAASAAAAAASAGTTVPTIPPGFSLGLFGENLTISGITFPTISAVIQAYKKDNDVQILSTPQILTTDNQEAKISVGKNVPFQTTATATSSGNEVYNSFEYRDVGKTLKITPQISKDRMVRLQLSLEVSDLQSTTDFRPTTLKRTVETTAIVKDGHTVVLGGLIDDTVSNTDYRVPCLGDIPGLGWLFRTSSRGHTKTNLYVFLTPRVIQNPEEATKVSNQKREDIDQLREQDIKLHHMNPVSSQTVPGKPAVEAFKYREEVEPQPADQSAAPTNSTAMEPSDDSPNKMKATPVVDSSPHEPAASTPSAAANPPEAESGSSAGANNLLQRQPVDPGPEKPGLSSTERKIEQVPASPGTAAAGTAAAAEGAKYTVQVASVQSVQQADQILQQLTGQGYAAYAVQTSINDKTWYRLRIGYFDRPEATHELMDRLRSDHFDPILIKY
jgi:general secretion pathway protein D